MSDQLVPKKTASPIVKTRPHLPASKESPTSTSTKAIIVSLVIALMGCVSTLGGAVITNEGKTETPQVVSCSAEISKALELRKEHPEVAVNYDNEIESQCHLNDAIRQIPSPAQKSP